MPEFPFLQVLVENLAAQMVGQAIQEVHLTSPSVLKTVDPPLAEVRGRTITRVRRGGKLVILDLTGGLSIVFHLMRNGRFQIGPARPRGHGVARPSKDTALLIRFQDGRELRFVEIGPKKRAALYVLPSDAMDDREPLEGLGIDPLSDEFTVGRLRDRLASDSGQLKHALTQIGRAHV